MVTACPRCGATRTESVHRGLLYAILRKLGYRLRRCSRCRLRIFRTHEEGEAGPERMAAPQGVSGKATAPQGVVEEPVIAEQWPGPGVRDPDDVAHGSYSCPRCGSTHYRRSRRTTLERILMHPIMARCRKCRFRFPYPGQ